MIKRMINPNRIVRYSLTGLALLTIAGCSSTKEATSPSVTQTTVTAAKARYPEATMTSLEEGRQIYLANCNQCHAYKDLSGESEEKWPRIVATMGKKKKISLSDEQIDLVTQYVVASHAALNGEGS